MIQFLLDTNAFLWYFWGDSRMESVQGLLTIPQAEVFVSSVSWWEIAIKVRLGKIDVNMEDLRAFAEKFKFRELKLDWTSTKVYLNLPKIHNDPFDHMLIAQAITAPMRFVTGDAILAEYSSVVVPV